MNKKNPLTLVSGFLNGGKFVILIFKPITNIDAVGQKRKCKFNDHTGVVMFDKCVVTADVDHSTEHIILLVENRPRFPGAVSCVRN